MPTPCIPRIYAAASLPERSASSPKVPLRQGIGNINNAHILGPVVGGRQNLRDQRGINRDIDAEAHAQHAHRHQDDGPGRHSAKGNHRSSDDHVRDDNKEFARLETIGEEAAERSKN